MHNDLNGQVLAFFSMVVAAAEVVVGLAIIVSVYRRRQTVDVDDARELRWWRGSSGPDATARCSCCG